LPISAFYPHFSVLSPFQCFIPISAFYPHFSVLSPFQRFIPISAFYPHFSVLSPFQRFIPISAFQRFIPISVSAFSFRFRDSVSAFYPYPSPAASLIMMSKKIIPKHSPKSSKCSLLSMYQATTHQYMNSGYSEKKTCSII
jgi:hypothetical protein